MEIKARATSIMFTLFTQFGGQVSNFNYSNRLQLKQTSLYS